MATRDFTVRRLGPMDGADMAPLLDMFAEAFEDDASYRHNRPDAAYTARLLNQSTFVALVAECEGRVVGGLTGYELIKFEQARSEFYIYDLAVAGDHRRRGVATALIRAMAEIARKAGGYVVFVQADLGDDPAIALYSKLGAREDVLHFDIAVPWKHDK